MNSKISILSILCLLSLAKFSFALNCFECNSYIDEACWDKTKLTDFEKNCETVMPGAISCKIVQQSIGNETRIQRSCSKSEVDLEEPCIRRLGVKAASNIYCHCIEPLCNLAPASVTLATFVTLAVCLGGTTLVSALLHQ